MKKTLLSICIPTYNRAFYLNDFLEKFSKFSIDFNLIELSFSDNASEDETLYILNKWKVTFPNFVFSSNTLNIGFDRNLHNSIFQSNGIFCLPFGDDDLLDEEGLKKLLIELDSPFINDLYILSGKLVNNDLTKIKHRRILKSPINNIFKLTTPKDLASYIDSIYNDISFLFLFMGSLVIRKEVLDIKIYTLMDTGYDHVYNLLNIIFRAELKTIKILNDTFYYARTSQNSYNNYRGSHFYSDLKTFKLILDKLKLSKNERKLISKSIGRLFLRQHNFHQLIVFSRNYKDRNLIISYKKLLFYYSILNIYTNFAIFLSSEFFYKTIRFLYKFIKSKNI
jgi:abequosyltransferase